MTDVARKIVNFIAFQAAWFAAVLGAANGKPWLGVIAVSAALVVHLALCPVPERRPELLMAMCAGVLGFCVDTGLVAAGAFSPTPFGFPKPFSSLWMVMLWVNLGTTLNGSMGWLRGRYALAAIFGAIGGPMTYYSGAKLGAVTHIPEQADLIVIGAVWTVALPLLFLMAKLVNDRFRGPMSV